MITDKTKDDLADGGYAVMRGVGFDGFKEGVEKLGHVFNISTIALDNNSRAYLSQPKPVPFHTDHPRARFVAWYCREQDYSNGENLLVDGSAAVAACSEVSRDHLTTPCVVIPTSNNDQSLHPLWTRSTGQIYYAPWLVRPDTSQALSQAVREFQASLEPRISAAISIRLERDDVLVVDNYRMLHGRRHISPDGRRELVRAWIEI